MKRCLQLLLMTLPLISGTARAAVPTTQELKSQLQTQVRATHPDFIVFVPNLDDDTMNQTGNEHFLVFDGPDGSLMTVWTQSTGEGNPDQHIVFSRSDDEGKTWAPPRLIAGPAKKGQGLIASWAYPLVSKSGRIYVLYSQHVGKVDTFFHTTGRLDGIFSDDNGKSWSAPQTVTLPRSPRDNPDASMPPNMICWQKPQRVARDGKYFAGITRCTSKAIFKNPTKSWTTYDSATEFMRFENIDDNPEVSKIKITFFGPLRVQHPQYPAVSVCQEPSIVKLPDSRLFCVMRTMTGHPYWSISADAGETWSSPQVLLDHDGGAALLHPLSPCPIYAIADGEFIMLIHNNDGHYKGSTPEQCDRNRQPINLFRGHFALSDKQPIRFDGPEFFMDHDGTNLGAPGSKGRIDLAMYSSFTIRNGQRVLWYPDRKFFLLGRIIGG